MTTDTQKAIDFDPPHWPFNTRMDQVTQALIDSAKMYAERYFLEPTDILLCYQHAMTEILVRHLAGEDDGD